MTRTPHGVDEEQLSERFDALVERAEEQNLDWASELEDAPDELMVRVPLLATLTGTDPKLALLSDELPGEA